MNYKQLTNCRVCDSDKLTAYLDLGELPLSNNLATSTTDKIHNERYPLKVMLCEECGLSQLSIVIPPEVLFSHYVYRSSIAQGYVDHCRLMAKELKSKLKLNQSSFHIDIAGNDCALLKEFQEEIGLEILNVDPAENLVPICEAIEIPTLNYFWGMDAARRVLNSFGPADLITATNVFAHVDNVKEFLEAVKLVLKQTGVLVMEFPYLIDFIENSEFDTVYFEHLSYFSIYPLTLLCEDIGLNVLSIEKQDIHGGSVRVMIGYGVSDKSVFRYVFNERRHYANIARYNEFSEDVQLTINKFRSELNRLKSSGKKIAGFAASAKGNTLLNCSGVTIGTMSYIVDETPEKIGKYSPGTRIPIVSLIDMMRNPPDYLVILSWNFLNEIILKCKLSGYKGKFIVPIPEFKIIDN